MTSKGIALLFTSFIFFTNNCFALGLAARFGDIIVENAQIGRTYNLRETLRIPLGVENRSTAEVTVVVEFEQPSKKILSDSYEVIPDPSWLKSIPDKLRIGPKSVGFFDILLTIPDDPTLNHRHFQAIIKARTIDTGLIAVAVENKLRFSIGPGPSSIAEEKRSKAMAKLDFNVSPQNIYITDVPVGTKFDVKKEQNKAIRVANYATDPLSIRLKSDVWSPQIYKPEVYEAIPDPNWIKFKKDTLEINPEEIGSFTFTIEIPNEPQYKGKSFAGIIRSELTTGFWLDAPVKVFITTKE
jgi:hypothetical protein